MLEDMNLLNIVGWPSLASITSTLIAIPVVLLFLAVPGRMVAGLTTGR